MSWRVRRWCSNTLVLGAAVVLSAACEAKKLPAAPDELATGIVIYEGSGFTGGSALLTTDVSDLRMQQGPCEHRTSTGYLSELYYDWNDCISSIKVAPGWQATVFVNADFHQDWLDVTADVPDLNQVRGYCDHDTWNDCITSIRVRRQ